MRRRSIILSPVDVIPCPEHHGHIQSETCCQTRPFSQGWRHQFGLIHLPETLTCIERRQSKSREQSPASSTCARSQARSPRRAGRILKPLWDNSDSLTANLSRGYNPGAYPMSSTRTSLQDWNLTPTQAAELQRTLRERVVADDCLGEVKRVAGVDASYRKAPGRVRSAVAVLAYPGLELIDHATAELAAAFPYIPGLLSFRE
ncbi:MAG TPA: hypothetical protein ENL35_06500, partial [Chloroflexi bacterium]|nr:hypothetical protein [Chloroflexota bacterium]